LADVGAHLASSQISVSSASVTGVSANVLAVRAPVNSVRFAFSSKWLSRCSPARVTSLEAALMTALDSVNVSTKA
jgi:hypothetical protein